MWSCCPYSLRSSSAGISVGKSHGAVKFYVHYSVQLASSLTVLLIYYWSVNSTNRAILGINNYCLKAGKNTQKNTKLVKNVQESVLIVINARKRPLFVKFLLFIKMNINSFQFCNDATLSNTRRVVINTPKCFT